VNDKEIKSSYVLAFITEGYCLYLGTKQANPSDKISEYLNERDERSRPSLLCTQTTHPLILGQAEIDGLVIYSGHTQADFLSRLRIYENKSYHWEVFRYHNGQLEVLPEGHGLQVLTSIVKDKKTSGSRWEQDNRQCRGTFSFGNFLGSAWIGLSNQERLSFEVISLKLDYETEYLALIKDLSDQALTLLLDFEAPTSSKLVDDPTRPQKSALESFLILRAALPLKELKGVMAMIKSRPHSILESEDRWVPTSVATGLHAMADPIGRIRWGRHPKSGKPVPTEVLERKRKDTTDTPPNQFIKYALGELRKTCSDIAAEPNKYGKRNSDEAEQIGLSIDLELRSPLLRSVSRLTRIPFENQVLQKREGYRQILRTWILSKRALAAKDLQSQGMLSPMAENRHVPDLYEYWLFFFLAKALEELDGASNIDQRYVKKLNSEGEVTIKLAHDDKPQLTIEIKDQGLVRHIGLYYNRTFRKEAGPNSYSMSLRPDYTVETFVDQYGSGYTHKRDTAANKGDISYLHFDAKFRIQKVGVKEIDADAEAIDDLSAKPEDIYKMHTYNEAIRGSAASIILYPGNTPEAAPQEGEELSEIYRKYLELIPGVGALAIKPGDDKSRDAALASLRKFILSAFGLMPNSKTHFSEFKKWEVNASKARGE
jgi:predicted component of viral defense system (DUF524 family)